MTAEQAINAVGLEKICCPCPNEEISGVYIGDLLSWVMGRASAGNVWITIMSNINIIAVASLVGVSCIILSENVDIDEEVVETAKEKGINIFRTQMTTYQTAVKLSEILK